MNETDFKFFIPTCIEYGRGKLNQIGEIIPANLDKILIITDPGSFTLSGAEGIIKRALSNRTFKIFDKVEENPSFENIEEGKKFAEGFIPDLVLGIGGGSAMDAAKGIAVIYNNKGKISDFVSGSQILNKPLPVYCIPTTSGTGSEVTPFAVFSDKKNNNKCGFSNPDIFAQTAVIDPSLTDSMPEVLRINTGLDVLTHAIEAYLSLDSNQMNDIFALQSIDLVLDNLQGAIKKDQDSIDRMSYASMLAGIAITHASTILLHIMAYPLTVYHKIPHGRANAVLLTAFLDFMETNSTTPDKVSIILEKFIPVGGIVNFLNSLNVESNISVIGIKETEIENFAEKTIVKSDVKITPAVITKETIMQIYKKAFKTGVK